jgi:Tfp pilus assembly protein PilX
MLMKTRQIRKNEQGFASLLIGITLVIVLSLLTLGFAELMRNEQNQVTSRQLSSQAFYAAESGINDAARALGDGYATNKTTCPPLSVTPTSPVADKDLSDPNVDGTNSQWSCLLIDTSPKSLDYSSIGTDSPTTFLVKGDTGGIVNVKISWQDTSSATTAFRSVSGNSTGAFPTQAAWDTPSNVTGMLRLALTGIPAGGGVTRASLISNTFNAFLYPADSTVSGSNIIPFTTTQSANGSIVDGHCSTTNTPRYCSVTITNIPASNAYLLFDLRSVYGATNVDISANGGTVGLVGAQSLVDSTGRALNVLKRIQVRIPSKDTYNAPDYAIESADSICKQLLVIPGATTDGCTDSTAPDLSSPTIPPIPPFSTNGAAAFTICPPGGCVPYIGPPPPLSWYGKLYNTSPNPDSNVEGCIWDFGDGGADGDPTPTATTSCDNGDTISHNFYPGTANPTVCYTYTIKLTVILYSGPPATAVPYQISEPRGLNSPC